MGGKRRRCRGTKALPFQGNHLSVGGSARSHATGRWLAGLVGLVLLVAGLEPAAAAGRHAAMVIDANTGRVLHAQAADEPRYPASLTKLMTLYLVFEAIEQGRASPTTRIRISSTAAATAPSKLGLEAGSDIALRDAVKILIVKSANDIAVAIAEHIAGSEAKFAALMTRKAHQIGMTATTFHNAHGLPDPGQITTARDMLTLALRLNDDFAKYYSLFALRSFSYGGANYRNHNTMLGSYAGMDGLKTGYTTSSGFNLVASVRRDGRHVIAVVFGGATAGTRNAHMRAILDRTLPRASTQRTRRQVPVAHAPPARTQVPARTQAPERIARAEPKPQTQPRLVEPVRPVAQPVPTHKPGPARADRVATPRLAEPAVPPQPVPPHPAPLAVPEPPASPGAPVVIAKVRPVAVTPVPRRVVRQRASEPAPVAPVAQTPPAAPAAKALPAAPFPMAEEPPSGRPLPPGQRFALGAPPSTLQAQAERISLGQQPAPALPSAAALPRPAPQATPAAPARPTRPAAGPQGPMIQIGAYANETEAQRRLAAVQALLAAPLTGARPVTQRVLVAGRTLYRARFSGLDAGSAAKVCNELRRQQVDCLVTAGP